MALPSMDIRVNLKARTRKMSYPKQSMPTLLDVYDEEFHNNLKIARDLIGQMETRGDKAICKKWIGRLVKMKSADPIVKKNRNAFFQYMLSVMEKAANESAYNLKGHGKLADEDHYMCKWSPDKRTYMAAKPLPGVGTLVYLAVAREPNLGWDYP